MNYFLKIQVYSTNWCFHYTKPSFTNMNHYFDLFHPCSSSFHHSQPLFAIRLPEGTLHIVILQILFINKNGTILLRILLQYITIIVTRLNIYIHRSWIQENHHKCAHFRLVYQWPELLQCFNSKLSKFKALGYWDVQAEELPSGKLT